MSLDYLSKYLKKDSRKSNKRKREHTGRIIEDDLMGWTEEAVHSPDDSPIVMEQHSSQQRSAGFRPAYANPDLAESLPQVGGLLVGSSSPHSSVDKVARLSSGARAGLQTKAQVAADIDARKAAQSREFQESKSAFAGVKHETVYRDATGRRIDITLAKQEKARELKRAEDRKEKERLLTQGLVQQQEKERKRIELEQVSSENFSRYAGHADTEKALKQRDRWDDPAAGFLSSVGTSKPSGSSLTRPVYKGGFAPNRFTIKPGYRWDGVDRGNGFEARRFKEIANQNAMRATYETWAREDM